MKFKTMRLAVLAATALAATGVNAQQTEGPWMVRARIVDIMPKNESDASAALPADAVTLKNVVAPEVTSPTFSPRTSPPN